METEDPNDFDLLENIQGEADALNDQKHLERKKHNRLEGMGTIGGKSYSNGDSKHSDELASPLDRFQDDPKEDFGID